MAFGLTMGCDGCQDVADDEVVLPRLAWHTVVLHLCPRIRVRGYLRIDRAVGEDHRHTQLEALKDVINSGG